MCSELQRFSRLRCSALIAFVWLSFTALSPFVASAETMFDFGPVGGPVESGFTEVAFPSLVGSGAGAAATVSVTDLNGVTFTTLDPSTALAGAEISLPALDEGGIGDFFFVGVAGAPNPVDFNVTGLVPGATYDLTLITTDLNLIGDTGNANGRIGELFIDSNSQGTFAANGIDLLTTVTADGTGAFTGQFAIGAGGTGEVNVAGLALTQQLQVPEPLSISIWSLIGGTVAVVALARRRLKRR